MKLPYRSGQSLMPYGNRACILLVLVVLWVVSCASSTPVVEPTATAIPPTPTATTVPETPVARHGVMPGLTAGSEASRSVEPEPLLASVSPDAELESATADVTEPAGLLELVDEPEMAESDLPQFPATTYTVQSGDTLLGIAFEYGVPLAALQLANDLGDSFLIRVGQELAIPAHREWAQASRFWIVHLVTAGETLGALAARYGLSLSELEAANPGLNVDRIAIGQALVLPLDGPADLIAAAANRTGQSTALAVPQPSPTIVVPADTAAPAAEPEPAADPELPAEPPPAPPAAEPAPPPQPPTSVAVPIEVAGLPAEIFRLVNEQRAAHNLPPLVWNDILARAAQRHANDCHARGWCSHTGSDGSSFRQRIIREGYNPVRTSECWAWYGTAVRAVAMWMDEVPPNDPHRRTILHPALTEVGVGVVPGNGFGYYFIAKFGASR